MAGGAFDSVMPTESPPRAKAGVGIHDFLTCGAVKSWMPTFVGMTRVFLGVV
jgi:hypothetical protein